MLLPRLLLPRVRACEGSRVTHQPTLFPPPTMPPTSREARRDGVASGRIPRNQNSVMEALRAYPGSTAGELGKYTGLGRVEAARRLSDMAKAGLVLRGESRVCTVQNNRQLTWVAA